MEEGDDDDLSKRNKYTPIACNLCRKRKTKCSGERPACSRCIERSTTCNYRDRRNVQIEEYEADISEWKYAIYDTPSTTSTIRSQYNTYTNNIKRDKFVLIGQKSLLELLEELKNEHDYVSRSRIINMLLPVP
eukprot:TRINITY_DN486_c1_g1_i4.p1 TRINITY_DN486_c1_g1~~TRINITY_DN486_c1_g1_i4.p1  ORF type:complete len:133 (-),score=19.63 TRINITY_DN486_c1_g1_i4:108-506(-)